MKKNLQWHLRAYLQWVAELIFANIDIVLFEKAPINKIYSSNTVYLNSGDKFRFLIRSDKSDNFDITLTKNSEETDKNRIKINANVF